MKFYLVAYELQNHEESFESMFHLLNSQGKAIQVNKHAIILASELSAQEIHDAVRDHAEYYDEWIITKLDKEEFVGKSAKVELVNRFLRNHGFR